MVSVAGLVEADSDPEFDGRLDLAFELLANDGVPDWNETFFVWGGEIFHGDRAEDARDETFADLASDMMPPIVGRESVCDLCIEAQRWLIEWCSAYIWSRYREDILDHWEDDEINRTYTMARLVVACRNRWVINGRRMSPSRAKALVDASLIELRAAASNQKESTTS